jgi:hypothetical protein
MKAEEAFALRRSVQPYVTLGAIFGGVAIWALVLAYRKLDRGTAESAVLLLAFYAAYVFLGMWYRIRSAITRSRSEHSGNATCPFRSGTFRRWARRSPM